MDPIATLNEMIECMELATNRLNHVPKREALEHFENLWEWACKGGFIPHVSEKNAR